LDYRDVNKNLGRAAFGFGISELLDKALLHLSVTPALTPQPNGVSYGNSPAKPASIILLPVVGSRSLCVAVEAMPPPIA